jgi:hypothetical protein
LNDKSILGSLWKWIGRVVVFALVLGILQTGGGIFLGGVLRVFFIWSFIGNVLIAIMLAWIISKVHLRRLDLAGLVWLVLFVVQQFNNMIEALFFTTRYSSAAYFAQSILTSLLTSLAAGILAAVLFQPTKHEMTLVSELSSYFDKRSAASWAWRIAVGSLAYFPIYFFFGALISPFVVPYYMNPSTGLKIPSFTVIIPLEFFRGFLYVLSLLGIFAAVKANRRTMSLIAACILYVPGGLVPLMLAAAARALPLAIIPFHLTEILADSVLYGAVVAYFLSGRKKLERDVDRSPTSNSRSPRNFVEACHDRGIPWARICDDPAPDKDPDPVYW